MRRTKVFKVEDRNLSAAIALLFPPHTQQTQGLLALPSSHIPYSTSQSFFYFPSSSQSLSDLPWWPLLSHHLPEARGGRSRGCKAALTFKAMVESAASSGSRTADEVRKDTDSFINASPEKVCRRAAFLCVSFVMRLPGLDLNDVYKERTQTDKI
ncbi:hypothetical protein E2C01_006613 [Portunus trituberculatus]|uniref:Uncharacterized protein n=1 Tax=Portunus trituberculatus TaxID=210409 RepID=A0A5B7CYM1_PORTR|nr:hypothetical protein [Portunus trituberculatus]